MVLTRRQHHAQQLIQHRDRNDHLNKLTSALQNREDALLRYKQVLYVHRYFVCITLLSTITAGLVFKHAYFGAFENKLVAEIITCLSVVHGVSLALATLLMLLAVRHQLFWDTVSLGLAVLRVERVQQALERYMVQA
jgi:hypothetical protein